MAAETVSAKAQRLFEAGCVTRPDPLKPRLFAVRSGPKSYRVIVGRHMCWCNCPSGVTRGACSHIEAARLMLERGT